MADPLVNYRADDGCPCFNGFGGFCQHGSPYRDLCGHSDCDAQAEYVYDPLDIERCSKHIPKSHGISWKRKR